jgi:electron-transferring-flavoprotein dehydrogenase
VIFADPETCKQCGAKICIEGCSGQAIMPGDEGVPRFDREKCVFCGACLWNCSQPSKKDPEKGNIRFEAGSGGLHSTVN